MDNITFHTIADDMFEQLLDAIEDADEEGNVDAELLQGILTVTLDSGQQFVLNKHEPTQQIWLSSPLSGAVHYIYNVEKQGWAATSDGHHLLSLLQEELEELANLELKIA